MYVSTYKKKKKIIKSILFTDTKIITILYNLLVEYFDSFTK